MSLIDTCDNAAMLQIFELNELENIDINDIHSIDLKQYMERLNIWWTEHNNITCIDYLDSKDLILTCAHDKEIILWTINGIKIGMFG